MEITERNTEPIYESIQILYQKKGSTIVLIKHRKTQQYYLAKISFLISPIQMLLLKNETNVLSKLSHPRIITPIQYYSNQIWNQKRCNILILEYCKHGDLFEYLASKSIGLSEAETKYIFYQLVFALKYMKDQHQCMHGDIKPENMVITSFTKEQKWPNLKIIDFAFAKKVQQENLFYPFRCVGTPRYASPESFFPNLGSSGYASDIWSLAICLFVMVEKRFPRMIYVQKKKKKNRFDHQNEFKFNRKQLRKTYYEISQSYKDEKLRWSSELRHLYHAMTEMRPENRITYEQILNHPWMKKVQPIYLAFKKKPRSVSFQG